MNKRIVDRSPWIVTGFVIGVSISLFVCFGVMLLLTMIKKLGMPEHEVLLLTVLFYGGIFFIAHMGLRTETRRNRALISKYSIKDCSNTPIEMKSAVARTKTVLWNVTGIVSVAWLTPALIIYWTAPRHPNMAYSACAFLFGVTGGALYLLKTGKQHKTARDRFLFFVGVCSGVIAVICVIAALYP